MSFKLVQRTALIGAASMLMAFSSFAGAAQVQTPDQISTQYDAAMEQCKSLKGNDKDVCKKEAKAQRDSAKADAKAGKKEAEARHDATEEKRDAAYGVEKEKCDAMSGDAKDQCVANAKTKYGK
ncbi:hypothetical protein H0A71_01370 [Alcaligenaceae bacterium]|nr:hypothetical protein [Alcaligenaceae bacterium]